MIKHILITALALAAATWILSPSITLVKPLWPNGVLTLIGVAIIFGVVNGVVKPLFKTLTGCFIMLTFGLLLLVINACMMLLTSWACGKLGLGWTINGDGWFNTLVIAVEGSLIVSVVSFVAAKLLGGRRRPARAQ